VLAHASEILQYAINFFMQLRARTRSEERECDMDNDVKGIWLDPRDNVVTVIKPVCLGDQVYWEETQKISKIVAVTNIPRFHKIAVKDIPCGSAIIKYGHVIGFAVVDIKRGSHVHTQNCKGTAIEELKA